jgi:hypothetical protein
MRTCWYTGRDVVDLDDILLLVHSETWLWPDVVQEDLV